MIYFSGGKDKVVTNTKTPVKQGLYTHIY